AGAGKHYLCRGPCRTDVQGYLYDEQLISLSLTENGALIVIDAHVPRSGAHKREVKMQETLTATVFKRNRGQSAASCGEVKGCRERVDAIAWSLRQVTAKHSCVGATDTAELGSFHIRAGNHRDADASVDCDRSDRLRRRRWLINRSCVEVR